MANALTTQIVQDGARNATVKVVAFLDTSNQAAADIVDPANFNPVPTSFRIDKIEYAVSDQLVAQILWDATADVIALLLTGPSEIDFRKRGGLHNNAGAGKTGKIQLATTGWASGSQSVTLKLELVKIGV